MREIDGNFYGTFDGQPEEKCAEEVSCSKGLKKEKVGWAFWRNVFWFNVAWLLITLGASVVYFMESTIYDQEGLGVVSLAVSMITSAIGCYVTEPILQKIGCRWTLVTNCLGNIVFYLANFYANWYTLVLASAIDGFTTGLGTVASYAFIAHTANAYANRAGADQDRTQSRVSIMYLVFCNTGVVVGNALAPLIFSVTPSRSLRYDSAALNASREAMLTKCGFGHHPTSSLFPQPPLDFLNPEFQFQPEIDYLKLVELMELCLGVTILAVFVLIMLVDTSAMDREPKAKAYEEAAVPFVINDYRIFLLIPTALVIVGGSSFWAADFAKCFVACSIGIESLGYVTLWTGVGGTLSGVLFGWFNTKSFRVIPLVIAPLSQIGVLVFLLYWVPTKGSLLLLCLLTVAWYLGIGVRNALFPALIAVVCPDIVKSAYATLYTMTFVGSTLVFLWSNWLQMDVKIFIMLGMFTASFAGYVVLEFILYHKRRRTVARYVPVDKNGNPDENLSPHNNYYATVSSE